MTTSTRVERRRGRRVREILTAAAELFGERGYDAVSLEDVADRLDVTKGSLYYYFRGKDELGAAAIEALGTEWNERLAALPDEGTATERLRALLREHIGIAVREYPAALRLFLMPRDWPEDLAKRIKAMRREHDRIFRTVLEDGVHTGEFTPISVDTTLQCLHASMSQAPAWCSHLGGRRREQAIDELTGTLLMLVGVSPGSSRSAAPRG